MKKVLISETQKKAIESQMATNIVLTILSVITLVAGQVLGAVTEAKEEETSQSND